MQPNVTVDDVAPHVKQITLNRPERLNALNFELTADLHDALDAVGADAECRVAILTGAAAASAPASTSRTSARRPAPGEHPPRACRHRRPGVHGQPHRAHALDTADHRRRGERRRLRRWARHRRGRRSAHRRRVGHVLLRVHPHRSHRHRHRRQLHAPPPPRRGHARSTSSSPGAPSTHVEAEHLGLVTRVVPDDALHDEAVALASQIAAYTGIGLRMTKEVMWANLDAPNMSAAIALENRNQTIAAREPGGAGLHGRSTWRRRKGSRDEPVTRSTTSRSSACYNTSRRACSRATTRSRSRSRRAWARSPTPGSAIARHRRRRRPARQRLRVPGAHRPGVALARPAWASRRCSRRAGAIANGLRHHRAHHRRRRRASTPTARRPRRGHARRNEFVAPFGMFTAAEFALIARRHMHLYGTTPEALATVAATIRNNGHVNPEAVLLRARAVHRAGHPRQPHGRRPVPPPRLRDDRRRVAARSC